MSSSTIITLAVVVMAVAIVYYVYTNHVVDHYTSAQPPPPFQTNVSEIQPYMSYEHPIQGIDCTSDCPTDAVVAGGNYYYLDGYPVTYGYDRPYSHGASLSAHGGHGHVHIGHAGSGHGGGGHR